MSSLPDTFEKQVDEALDYFADCRAHPYRDVPPARGAIIALLRGAAAALNEDDLGETFRWPTERQRTWWQRGYYGTHRLTRWRFDRWDCTRCGNRVGGPGPEHTAWCRQWAVKR